MAKFIYAIVVVAVAVIIYQSAAAKKPARSIEERIEAEVQRKIGAWKDRRLRDCRQKALDIALLRADSMIMDYAREQKLMLDRPSRPLRPEEPALRRPNDTLTLAPFLSDSL